MLRIAVTQRRLEPGGERHDRRVHDDSYQYVKRRVAQASKACRIAQYPVEGDGVQQRDRNVAAKGSQKLRQWHCDPLFRQHVRREGSSDVKRPVPARCYQQRA